MTEAAFDRRFLLRGAAVAGVGLVAAPVGLASRPQKLHAAPALVAPALPERRIAFRNVHTDERVDARFFRASGWDEAGLAEINHGLRDWRTGEVHAIDRKLIALLTDLRETLDVAPRKAFDLISGYRSPATNGALRMAGGAHTGVATKSQHMLGKATDIALPGVPLDRLRAAARAARRGGVGYYPRDGFVHVDTARVRFW
jgi:uncharacterized protein YcbK (DUF882 family)